MFKKILVATDLSPASEYLIKSTVKLQSLGTREAVLVYCMNIRDVGSLADTLLKLIQPALQKQEQILINNGFKTEIDFRLGIPAVEITRTATEKDCSMIVIGSHGYSLTKEILLGGVATAVIHSATKPILLVRMKFHKDAKGIVCEEPICDPLYHVLYPTDFSDNAEQAFLYLENLAQLGAKKITLIHVQDQTIGEYLKDRLDEFNKIDLSRLERLQERLKHISKADIKIKITYGSVKQEILNYIKNQGISFVVMGSKGRGRVSEFFLGSVSYDIARNSPVAVLLVPPGTITSNSQ
ncbi:MAG: universal stress protein [candidate division WOR-3 bacterium]